ncbi:MAG TPA: phosphoribosylamine--glycine ligase [Victivallales bacterium]|nr:phosphoribosylamine--glycine ligase [Victivallales bacterium]
MKIFVIGNGGREHALCWKLNQSSDVSKIYCAPGNAGTGQIAENIDISVEDLDGLLSFALDKKIDLTVVGPEVPLCLGVVNKFRNNGLKIFGPDKESAQLEGSKCYAKNFMKKYNIPTADSDEFTECAKAVDYLNRIMINNKKVVIKADGLAAGKGVLIPNNLKEAIDAVKMCFSGEFGEAGAKVLIEEFLDGEEVSILAFTDGKSIKPLLASQDHKRIGENDTGLNTGGMGAYCPAPIGSEKVLKDVNKNVLRNFLAGIQKENLDFRGIIYAGIMVTAEGSKVLEFNVRFGDPEVQAVMSLLKSDLTGIMLNTVDQKLSDSVIEWYEGAAVCVVMASKGYPGKYEKGCIIDGIEKAEENGAVVFHAGTKKDDGKTVTAGGRVLGVTARGENIENAIENSYKAVDDINWEGAYFRRDIGFKAIQ